MIPRDAFPRLTENNNRSTSPNDVRYNCVAWAAKDTNRWWQPGVYWPVETSRDDHGIGALALAFKQLGYEECDSDELEPGFEKVALYGSGMMYTRAARQLANGQWTSKLGQLEDIEHQTPEDIPIMIWLRGNSTE